MILKLGFLSPKSSHKGVSMKKVHEVLVSISGVVPLLYLISLLGSVSAQDLSVPVGWATKNGGVTGGGSAAPVTVATYADLKAKLSSTTDKVIYVSGTIAIPAGGRIDLQDLSGKTIIGLPGSKIVSTDLSKTGSGILFIKRCTNFIIRNLIFEGPGAYDTDGYDNLCIDNCQNFWVDHCEFSDGMDGNFDIKNMSDFVSVTWCKFNYKKAPIPGGPGGAPDHRYSNLIGSSDDATADAGKLSITFYYCWWGEGCKERMPRIRYGKLHIVNTLFSSSVSNQCIRAGYKADLVAEGNYFDNQKLPIDEYEKNYTAIKGVNNYGAANIVRNTAFTPPYTLTVANPADIVAPIQSCAGAKLPSPTGLQSDLHLHSRKNAVSFLNTGKMLVLVTGNQSIMHYQQSVAIINVLGKTVLSTTLARNLDISGLIDGVYIVKVGEYTQKFTRK